METSSDCEDNSSGSSSRTLQAQVVSRFKFFHALSTFTSRPELLIPHVRSTDIVWDSIPSELSKSNNKYDSENIFDLLYSPIYYEGKVAPSTHVGELTGSLDEHTVSGWIHPNTGVKVQLQRLIHHKPLKDAKFGWTSRINELWDFPNNIVEVTPVIDDSTLLPYAPFPTLKATFLSEKSTCNVTIERFAGPLEANGDDSLEFYANSIVPKIFEWMSDMYHVGAPKLTRQRARPLSYISNSKYWHFYDLIKSGPAEYIKSIWQESTDPVKFIHEDIGIASYTASLIYDERVSTFRPNNQVENVDILDFGCGNGLLCFFLHEIFSRFSKNSRVVGYDIRRRKIWSQLLEKGRLKEVVEGQSSEETSSFELLERSIVPHLIEDLINKYSLSAHQEENNRSLWLIGNHSDELTPWIPVIARRMNATGFLIIPCCPFDFFHKYQRHSNLPGTSIYQNYIEYVCRIGDKFGYQPALENLRIPSTKKICLIGFDCRDKLGYDKLDSEVNEIMQMGSCAGSLSKFVPRTAESSKKCENVDRVSAKLIVDKIFQLLIEGWQSALNNKWYSGRQDLTFREIVSSLSKEQKDALKSKGNGLKSVVKSNRHLFYIEGDTVKLRTPDSTDISNVAQTSRDKIKTRECYFYSFHPQGCPLSEELCAFKHVSV